MPTLLIIGAGPNIGLRTAVLLSQAGYAVALASRHPPTEPGPYKHFVFDAASPDTVAPLFEQVTAALGAPSVVIYNAASRHTTDPADPFGLDLQTFTHDLAINTVSPYAAAQSAFKSFSQISSSAEEEERGCTFIFTGNKLNTFPRPGVLAFGTGKTATAYMIWHASETAGEKGYKFYYVDQRTADGGPTVPPGGEAHAKTFLELAKDPKQRAWLYTFVDGQGYTEFK